MVNSAEIGCILLNIYIPVIWSYTHFYYFGEDCSVVHDEVNEKTTAYIEYFGSTDMGYRCNDMSFVGKDSGKNKYKVCVTPMVFEDPNCVIELYYKEKSYGQVLKTYYCNNKPIDQFCNEEGDTFYIKIIHKGSQLERQKAHVQLKVEGVITVNYDHVGMIIGPVIAGVALLFGCCCWRRRNKDTRGQVLSSESGAARSNQVNTDTYATEPNRPSSYLSLTTNAYQTSRSGTDTTLLAQYQPTSQANQIEENHQTNYSHQPTNNQLASDLSKPPPSYDDAIKMMR